MANEKRKVDQRNFNGDILLQGLESVKNILRLFYYELTADSSLIKCTPINSLAGRAGKFELTGNITPDNEMLRALFNHIEAQLRDGKHAVCGLDGDYGSSTDEGPLHKSFVCVYGVDAENGVFALKFCGREFIKLLKDKYCLDSSMVFVSLDMDIPLKDEGDKFKSFVLDLDYLGEALSAIQELNTTKDQIIGAISAQILKNVSGFGIKLSNKCASLILEMSYSAHSWTYLPMDMQVRLVQFPAVVYVHVYIGNFELDGNDSGNPLLTTPEARRGVEVLAGKVKKILEEIP